MLQWINARLTEAARHVANALPRDTAPELMLQYALAHPLVQQVRRNQHVQALLAMCTHALTQWPAVSATVWLSCVCLVPVLTTYMVVMMAYTLGTVLVWLAVAGAGLALCLGVGVMVSGTVATVVLYIAAFDWAWSRYNRTQSSQIEPARVESTSVAVCGEEVKRALDKLSHNEVDDSPAASPAKKMPRNSSSVKQQLNTPPVTPLAD